MNRKTAIILPMMILAFLMVVGIVNATWTTTCSWSTTTDASVAPSASAATIRTANQWFNVSWGTAVINGTAGTSDNITYIEVDFRETGGTWYVWANKTVTNTGANNLTHIAWVNSTWGGNRTSSDCCYDSKTYEFRADAFNVTGASKCTQITLTGIKVDNTKPQCSIKTPVASTTYGSGLILFADTGNSSQKCKWTMGNLYTGTINGTTGGREDCYYDFAAGYPAEAVYRTVSLSVADQSNNQSTCSVTDITIDDEAYRGKKVKLAAATMQIGGITLTPEQQKQAGIALIIAVIVIIYLKGKKK